MKRLVYIWMIVAISLAGCSKSLSPEESVAIRETVQSQEYVFTAESVSPASGRNMPLTPGYDLVVTQKAVIATLPYFGRAYSVPIDPAAAGIRFTSKKFRYSAATNARGEVDILIEPEDVVGVQQLRLNISSVGHATLQVTSRDRQAITFYGSIVQNKAATLE
jgi:hypothetical protein